MNALRGKSVRVETVFEYLERVFEKLIRYLERYLFESK